MPPSRAKLHSKTGKLKAIKPVVEEPESTETCSATSTNRDSEVDRQFEVELCWCIQQLETYLASGKLNQKQSLETEKTLKILKSGKQPIIKKRQLMRTTFGDYRVKMAEEEKKMSLEEIKHLNISENNLHTDANQQKEHEVEDEATLRFSLSGNTFKFNFDITTEES